MHLTFWCLILVLISESTSQQIKSLGIYPKKAGKQSNGDVKVKCNATSPLAECQFRVRYHYANQAMAEDGLVFNITSEGGYTKTQVDISSTGRKLYDIEYQGMGLAKKECGIHLTDLHEGRYLVGCRARTDPGGWTERYMTVYVNSINGTTHLFESNNKDDDMLIEVMFEDQNATINLELTHFNFFTGLCMLEGIQNPTLRGSGILNKTNTTCHLPIVANDMAQGPLWAMAPSKKDNITNTWHFIKLIVVNRPKNVSLALTAPGAESTSEEGMKNFTEGDTISAMCTVLESRHGADISWMIGNQTLTHNVDGWTVSTKNNTDAWTWPWETKTIEQTGSKILNSTDNGQALQCIARYYDADGKVNVTMENSVELSVHKPPSMERPTARNADLPESQYWTVLWVTLCIILALTIVAGLIYARREHKYCFKSTAYNIDEMPTVQQPQRPQNKTAETTTTVSKNTAKQRAKTPEQPASQVYANFEAQKPNHVNDEQVAYAEITGIAAVARGRAKVTIADETTYAELSFE